MRSPFRRRRRRPSKRSQAPAEPEVIDWPKDGHGGGGLMSAIRGDSSTGAGFGAGMFADLQVAFGGAGKQIQLQEQEKEKTRRHEVHSSSRGGDNLDSGMIRITKRREPAEEGE